MIQNMLFQSNYGKLLAQEQQSYHQQPSHASKNDMYTSNFGSNTSFRTKLMKANKKNQERNDVPAKKQEQYTVSKSEQQSSQDAIVKRENEAKTHKDAMQSNVDSDKEKNINTKLKKNNEKMKSHKEQMRDEREKDSDVASSPSHLLKYQSMDESLHVRNTKSGSSVDNRIAKTLEKNMIENKLHANNTDAYSTEYVVLRDGDTTREGTHEKDAHTKDKGLFPNLQAEDDLIEDKQLQQGIAVELETNQKKHSLLHSKELKKVHNKSETFGAIEQDDSIVHQKALVSSLISQLQNASKKTKSQNRHHRIEEGNTKKDTAMTDFSQSQLSPLVVAEYSTRSAFISRKATIFNSARNQLQNFMQNSFIRQARLLIHHNTSGEIKLALQPRELGEVKFNIKVHENNVSAKVFVESDAIKELLLKNIEQLSKQFMNEGYEIGDFTVSVDSKNSENNTNDEQKTSKYNKKDTTVDLLGNAMEILENTYLSVSEKVNLIA